MDYRAMLKALGIKLDHASPAERPALFIEYARTAIAAADAGELTMHEAGERLMRGHQYDELLAIGEPSPARHITDEILDLASDLEELPYYPKGRSVRHDWQRLKDLIDAFDARRDSP